MIGIIDYGMGNLGSVTNACRFLELPATILTSPQELDSCGALILPGVGAFGDCLEHLRNHGWVHPVKDWIHQDRPFLGICLGLQALFEESEESPGVPGLGVLQGTVRRFPNKARIKIPQIGWNRVHQARKEEPLYRDIPDDSFFYFVHSYYVDATDPDVIVGSTEHGLRYTSAVSRGNLMAVQFHPEKSQRFGLQMLRNFSELVAKETVKAS